jgi:hypothetical protein
METCRGKCPSTQIGLANVTSDSKHNNTYEGWPNSNNPGWSIQMKCANDNARPKSFWHDIPLMAGEYYHFVCEIPQSTCQKNEMMTKREGNPIQMDDKNGLPRYNTMGPYPYN